MAVAKATVDQETTVRLFLARQATMIRWLTTTQVAKIRRRLPIKT